MANANKTKEEAEKDFEAMAVGGDAYKFQENYFIADYKYLEDGVHDLKEAAKKIIEDQLKIPVDPKDILDNATVE